MCSTNGTSTASRAARGFSLIEIMIVVVIMGILAAAVAMTVGGRVDTAKLNRAKSDIATLMKFVDTYYLENGSYPSNDEGLKVATEGKVHKDPWGKPYRYVSPGRKGDYEIISFGADWREGGEGANADISSDNLDADTAKKQ